MDWKRLPDAEYVPAVVQPEMPDVVRRALAAGMSKTARYIGSGMTSVVFCDGKRAFKVARRDSLHLRRHLADEGEWLATAAGVEGVHEYVARFESFDVANIVIVRSCPVSAEGVSYWRRERELSDLMSRIETLMIPHGWTAPEFKADSFVLTPAPVLVDAGFVSRVGQRLLDFASAVADGLRETDEPRGDLSFQIRREIGQTLTAEQAAPVLAKLGEPAGAQEASSLSVEDVERLPMGSILWWNGQALIVVVGGLAPVAILPERADSRAPDGESPASFGGPFTLIAKGRGEVPTKGTAHRKVMAWWEGRQTSQAQEASRQRKPIQDVWSGLDSQRAADARRMEAELTEISASMAHAKQAASRARDLVRPVTARAAKDLMIEAFNRVQKIYEQAQLTEKANHLRDLPQGYPPEHVFAQARSLLATHANAVRVLGIFKGILSHTTYGSPEQVTDALDRVSIFP